MDAASILFVLFAIGIGAFVVWPRRPLGKRPE